MDPSRLLGVGEVYLLGSVLVIGTCAVLVVVDLFIDRSREAEQPVEELSLEEIAVLAGGIARLSLVAALGLVRRGHVAVASSGGLTANVFRIEDGSAFERGAFTAVQRHGVDLHDVDQALRGDAATRDLLQGLVSQGLARSWGAVFARRPATETSMFRVVARLLALGAVLFAPLLVMAGLAGEDLSAVPDADGGHLLAVASGVVLLLTIHRLCRLGTRAGVISLRALVLPDDELWLVARHGVRRISDRPSRRGLRRSMGARYGSGGG